MELFSLDPLTDDRWNDLVRIHPNASVFHLRGWLSALRASYGYRPLVITSSPPVKPLTNGLVLCRVSSWITGARLVSLPFADHCEPLLDPSLAVGEFTSWLRKECACGGLEYAEIRPLSLDLVSGSYFAESAAYCFHMLDLEPPLERIFNRLHKDSMQRRIRKAERERLSYEEGNSPELLGEFYRLLVKTRRRHGVFPQPRLWFRNLVTSLSDCLKIRLARTN